MTRILAALLVVAVAMLAGGFAMLAMVGGAGCRTETLRRGQAGGLGWRIEQVDCGATVAEIWRLHVETSGRSALAFEAEGDPEPLELALRDGALVLRLASTDAELPVPLGPDGLPVRPLRFRRGQPFR